MPFLYYKVAIASVLLPLITMKDIQVNALMTSTRQTTIDRRMASPPPLKMKMKMMTMIHPKYHNKSGFHPPRTNVNLSLLPPDYQMMMTPTNDDDDRSTITEPLTSQQTSDDAGSINHEKRRTASSSSSLASSLSSSPSSLFVAACCQSLAIILWTTTAVTRFDFAFAETTTVITEQLSLSSSSLSAGEVIVYAYIGFSALAGVKGVYDSIQRKRNERTNNKQ
jgi:hypothetical protein